MNEIYDKYYYKIYYWAIKKTKNKEDAEDLTNSIFVAIFEFFNKDIKIEKIENLIWKIAYNLWCTKAKKYLKEKNNIQLDETIKIDYEVPILDKMIYKEIVTNLADFNLTPKEKIAFEMYYINDLSIKEISTKMNTKESNVKYFLYSARNKIKEKCYE